MKRHDDRPVTSRNWNIRAVIFAFVPLSASFGCSSEVLRVPATQNGQLIPAPTGTTGLAAGNSYSSMGVAAFFPPTYNGAPANNPHGDLGGKSTVWAWSSRQNKDQLAAASDPARIQPPYTVQPPGDPRIVNASAASTASPESTSVADAIPDPSLPPLPGESAAPEAAAPTPPADAVAMTPEPAAASEATAPAALVDAVPAALEPPAVAEPVVPTPPADAAPAAPEPVVPAPPADAAPAALPMEPPASPALPDSGQK